MGLKHLAAAVAAALLSLPGIAAAQAPAHYTVTTNGDIVQLRGNTADVTVSVLTPVNNAYEMVVKGQNVIRMVIKSTDDMRARPGLNGIPFLSPFANRLDEPAFYANGKKYAFDLGLGNVRGPIPIHGFLSGTSDWKIVEAKADGDAAWITSKLDFYKTPAYMKQFPFAHTITMTYRLSGGALEVRTKLDNLANEPMPVSIGFHPYFQLTDSVRKDWTLDVPAKTRWLLSDAKIPTGQTEPADTFFGQDRHKMKMSGFATKLLDDVFSDLDRDAQGRGKITVKGKKQALTITLGPNFKTLVLYSTVPNPPGAPPQGGGGQAQAAPPPPVSVGPAVPLSGKETKSAPADRGFLAIEPMVGITNAMNAAQKGTYKDLQSVPPGGSWQESFWISTTGY